MVRVTMMKRFFIIFIGLILLPLYFAQLGFTQTSDELKALKKGLLLP
jgi:hypothetical protein